MNMSYYMTKLCHDFERVEKMKFFVGYLVGGVLVATSMLYILNKRGVLNV